MSKGFIGQPCVLCGNPSTRKGEHVLPLWFIKDCQHEGRFTTMINGRPVTTRSGDLLETESLGNIKVPMCESCNGTLDTTLEKPAKPIIRRFTQRQAGSPLPSLTANECGALARWFLKICLLSNHPKAQADDPQVDRDPAFERLDRMDTRWLDWMRVGCNPPTGFTVYVWRESTEPNAKRSADTLRIFLPDVTVGAENIHFESWNQFLIGLQAVASGILDGQSCTHSSRTGAPWSCGRHPPMWTSANCRKCPLMSSLSVPTTPGRFFRTRPNSLNVPGLRSRFGTIRSGGS